MKPKALVFDFDGTLVDSYPAITASVNHVRSQYRLPPLSVEEVRRHVGRGAVYLLEHTVPGGNPERDVETYKAHHPSVLREGTRLLEQVGETLPRLHAAGFVLGICSNKPRSFTLELVDYLKLKPLISVVIGPEDAPRFKPAPDMLLAAMRQLNVSATETLYIGDMVVDIQTARAAGVPVWVVPTGSDTLETLRSAKPDRLLAEFQDLLELT